MKARIGILTVLCTILSCTSASKSANESTTEKQNREVGKFQKIQLNSGIDAYFTQEQSQSVRIETENVDVNEVVTEVKNGTLVIELKSNWSGGWKNRSIKAYISAPVLEGIDMSGGSDFYSDNLKSANFNMSTSGGADVKIGNLTVDNAINISTSGGSDYTIKNLKATNCNVNASGGSDLAMGVDISGKLSISTSGASDIKLSGTANSVWITASGAADVDVRNLKYNQIDSKASGGSDVRK